MIAVTVTAINGGSLTIDCSPGEIIGVTGPSGVGKTTMLRALSTYFLDQKIVPFVVYQQTEQFFPWLSVESNLQLTSTNYHLLVETWGLSSLLKRRPKEISGGQYQRLVLLRAISSNRKILLCDEPLSGVDSITAKEIIADFKESVKRSGQIVFWVSHNFVELVQLSSKTIVMTRQTMTAVNNPTVDLLNYAIC